MKHFTKITLAAVTLLLSSTSPTMAQQLSVMDMINTQKKAAPAVPVEPTIQQPIIKTPVTPVPVAPVAEAPPPPQVAAPVAVVPLAPLIVMQPEAPIAPPIVAQPVIPVPTLTPPAVEPMPVQQVVATAEPAAEVPEFDKYGVPNDLRNSLENDFKDKLSFALTQDKMIAYVRAIGKVEAINSRWDVEIAAAQTDKMAMENNNFAVEDITAALSNMKNLTMDEYNEMTALSAKEEVFSNIVNDYRSLLKSGAFSKSDAPENKDAAGTNPETQARIDVVQGRIDAMKAELQAVRSAPAPAAPAQADPLLSAQLDALTAKAQQVSERIEAINQRAADIEKKVKTN
jgi:hypothetical protein